MRREKPPMLMLLRSISVFEKQPLALAAENVRVPSFGSPESFRLQDGGNTSTSRCDSRFGQPRQAGHSDPLLGFLQSSTTSALAASERVAEALRDYKTPVHLSGERSGRVG